MAVSDTLVVVAFFGLSFPEKVLKNGWFEISKVGGDAFCRLISFLSVSSICSSFFNLFIISFQRFRSTSLRQPRPYTTRQRLTELTISWLASFFMAYAKTLKHSIIKGPSNVHLCSFVDRPIAWEICFFMVLVIVLCAIFTFSMVTLRRLTYNQTIQDSIPDMQRQTRKKKMAGAVKMVLTSLLLYSCCYLPFALWQGFKKFSIMENGPDSISCFGRNVLEFLSRLLSLVNSCFSPAIYLIFLTDFRDAAKRFLLCKRTNL